MKRLIGFFFLLAAILVPVLVQAEDETFLPYQQSGVDAANTNCEAFAAPEEPTVVSILCSIDEGYEPFEMVCGPDKTLYIVAFRKDEFLPKNGLLSAIAPDGTEKWKRSVSFLTWAPAIESGGDVYTASGDSVCRIAPDGRERWVYRDEKMNYEGAYLIPGHGLLVWGSSGPRSLKTTWDMALGSLTMLDPRGTKKWSRIGSYFRPVLCAAEEIACFGEDEKGRGLLVISPEGREIRFTPAWLPSWDVSLAGDGFLSVEFGRMRFFSLDGQSLWNWRHLDGLPRFPTIAPNGNIYVSSDDGVELACHGRDGKVKWQTRGQLGSNMRPLAFADSRVLICSTPGYGPLRVSLVDAKGQPVWSKGLPAPGAGIPANALAAFSDGTILVGLKNGRIYALKQQ